MQLPSDEQQLALIERIANGDADALGEMAQLVGPWVQAAMERTVEDAQTARDLTDQVFLEIWQTAPLWDRHVGRPLLWAIAIGRSLANDLLADDRRAQGVQFPSGVEDARDDGSVVGAMLAADPQGRAVLEGAWYGHPASSDGSALPSTEEIGPALTAFATRLHGGGDGG